MWRRLFRKPSEADLAEELDAHLAIETKQLMDDGLTREQAEQAARRLFGSRALTMEETREARGMTFSGRLAQDVRYALRVLNRGRAFTVAAVLSLALGIGATTAVFSIYDTVFLRPLPYRDPGQLVWVGLRSPTMGIDIVPGPIYTDWRRDSRTLELAATQVNFTSTMILGGPEPAEVHVSRISSNFLETLGVSPAAGRTFRAEEELPHPARTVLLTDPFWHNRLQARRDIVGAAITMDGVPFTVAGILPKSFVYPVDAKVDVLIVLNLPPGASLRDRGVMALSMFGRLKPGVTVAQARAELATEFMRVRTEFPNWLRGQTLVVQPLRDHRTGNVGKFLFVLMGAAACLLAIACANVANLLLARWSARSHELAVRAAIGAGRGRLARQLFTEIVLLIAGATAAGMLLVAIALRGFVHFAGNELPRLGEVTTDFRVFGIAVLTALLTALIFGGLPALRAGKIDPHSVLGSAGRGAAGGSRLLRRGLVTVEVALSVILLSCAALLFETLWHMQNDHLGFQPEHVLTVSIPLRGKIADSVRNAATSDVIGYLERIPGTEAVSLTDCSPISRGSHSEVFTRSDRPLPEPSPANDKSYLCNADAEYLKAAGIPLRRGRFLSEEDLHHPGKVAVLNEAAAEAFFPGEDPIGKQILGGRGREWKEVVGVAADTKNEGLNHPAVPEVFVNNTPDSQDILLVVRTLAKEPAFARALQEQIRNGHPGLLTKVETLGEAMDQLTAGPRFDTVVLAAFACIAFLMAIVGVYGVLAFSVTQRRAEIGVRLALGASPGRILALIMREGAVLIAIGVLAGIGGSLLLARSVSSLLYGVKAGDPVTYAAVIAGLGIAAALASFVPARRAAVVDPAITLRHQ